MKKYCLAIDLVDDKEIIEEYKEHHKKVWPEIKDSIRESGICNLEIYNSGNRLFMIMETNDNFSFELKEKMDADNAQVQEWEALMWKYQKALPTAKPGEKWVVMDKIFELKG